jgi:hypothetical protein
MKSRLELLKAMSSIYNYSTDWIMKMLGFDKRDIRKEKIKKMFPDETREV